MGGHALFNQFPSLAEAFLSYFDVDLVTTADQRNRVARLRYRVYCEEFGYEPTDAFPDKRESDAFDSHSLQCIVKHRGSGRTAGCVRLICAGEDLYLPLETYCRESIYVDYIESLQEDRDRICEVSRLAVDPVFRRRPGEFHTRLGEFDAIDCCHQEQRTFSLISIAAVLAGFAMSSLTGRTQIFTMMEANLPRLLRRAGILMQQAGDTTDYHGQRSAHFVATDFALENMREDLYAMYEVIYGRLAASNQARERVA
jgi:N-acyl amino acid synthase of PEP-CTERM/exosortase system